MAQIQYLKKNGELIYPHISVDQIYPVGSIYMSINSANPGDLFGGT